MSQSYLATLWSSFVAWFKGEEHTVANAVAGIHQAIVKLEHVVQHHYELSASKTAEISVLKVEVEAHAAEATQASIVASKLNALVS